MAVVPQISVVIPMFNSAQWVEETLESVVRQTYPQDRLEIIVVDDVSKDDSIGTARRFLERQSTKHRLVQRDTNGGVGPGRNSGLEVATGEWVQFLDSDDILAPHKLALQAEVAANAPGDVAVVYSNWKHYSQVDGRWQPVGDTVAPYVDDDPVLRILQETMFGYVGPSLFRRSAVERLGGFQKAPNVGEDSELMMRLAMDGAGFRRVLSEDTPFFYRQWPNSWWRTQFRNPVAMRNHVLSHRSAHEFLKKRHPGGLPAAARDALAMRYSRFADHYLQTDPETYRDVRSWLKELGYDRPVHPSPRVQMLTKLVGFENAVRSRAAFRKLVEPLRAWWYQR